MSVKFIKLQTGEELVASIEEQGEDKVLLKNPVKFIMTKDGVGMVPFFPLCKEKPIQMDSKFIMLVLELEDEIYNAYNSQLGTGIVVPTGAQTLKIVREEK